jgi:hypothetical protein
MEIANVRAVESEQNQLLNLNLKIKKKSSEIIL